MKFRRSTRPARASSGLNRSPVFLNRARTLSRRKSSIRTPRSISFHVTGVETQARGWGRTEYTDASVRVHACHTRLRELEILKDQLLGFLADDATLQPRDIVVMAPDIAAYAPYLPAAFGAPAHYDASPSNIPWHLADVPLAPKTTLG